MNVAEYFKVVSVNDRVIHLEHKGFWSDEVAEKIADSIMLDFRRAAIEASSEGPFIMLADLRRIGVLSRKGRIAVSRLMSCAKEYNMYKSIEIIPHAITRLSLREAAELSDVNNFRVMTESLEEALDIVETLKQEMAETEESVATT